ncbi:hypothetical protein M758_3G124000 [Ceratodon purpureus]|nr:hypothetical protein M758_3G124000 [Ceratodon purpureus]
MAHVRGRESRCECTLPCSLHLTVFILGGTGLSLSILVTVAAFLSDDRYRAHSQAEKYSAIWLLLTTIVVCVSGLQGLLVRPDSCCFNCHSILAVISLANLGVIGVSSLFVGNVFWIIYLVLVFVFELWVTVLRTCCKRQVGEVGMTGMELPIASPARHQEVVTAMPASVQHVVGIPAPSQPYKVDRRPEAAGSANSHLGYERFDEVR